MKGWIGEYGRTIITVLVGGILIAFAIPLLWNYFSKAVEPKDSVAKISVKENPDYRVPELKGLGTKEKPLSVKVEAGTVCNPINTKGILSVSAVDKKDGDLTEKIKVYEIKKDKQGKETQKEIVGNLDTSGKERQYTLLYYVENSGGFYAEQRANVLITKIGGDL